MYPLRFLPLLFFLTTFNPKLVFANLYDDPPLSESEINSLAEKYQRLFSDQRGPSEKLTTTARLGRILDDLENRLGLGQLVPEAAQLDDVNWDTVEKCYDALLLTEDSRDSVNLFNSTLKKVVRMYFDFHEDLLEGGDESTILRRMNHLMSNIYYLARETIQCVQDLQDNEREPTRLGLTPFAAYSDEEFADIFLMKYEELDKADDDTDNVVHIQTELGRRGRRPWNRPDDPYPNQDPYQTTERPWPTRGRPPCPNVTVPKSKWPKSYDWRDYKLSGERSYSVVTPVKHQGPCGSCYIFAGVASMESAFMLSNENKENEQTVFSEQALLNCARSGCRGGFETDIWRKAESRGVTLEKNCNYLGHREECRHFPSKARPTSFCQNQQLRSDDDIIGIVYQFGPSVIAINSRARSMKLLRGVWNRDCPPNSPPNHVVTVVGYTEDTFIAKNSWGRGFGKEGYLILKRDNTNRCGIYTEVGLPFFFNQETGYNT